MKQKTITTDEDYIKASKRMMEIFHASPNTPEEKELIDVIALLKSYDDKHYPTPIISTE
jgi:HTH-type transcriptional regulator / antitoxin HigA